MAQEELDMSLIWADIEVTLSNPDKNRSVVVLVDTRDVSCLRVFLINELGRKYEGEKKLGEGDDFWAILEEKFKFAHTTLDIRTHLELLELTGRDIEFIGRRLVVATEKYKDPYDSFIHIYDEFVKEGGSPDKLTRDQVLLVSRQKAPSSPRG